jgi:hypothetical protein
LLEVCSPEENILTTKTQPAYWLAPGESGFCEGGVTTAVNDVLVSDFIFHKTIEIGYQGIDNVIAFTAEVEVPEEYELMQIEIPTGYLTYEFENYYHFNPVSTELIEAQSQDLHPPWSFLNFSALPPILSTSDGSHAMGAYTQEEILGYGIHRFEASDPANQTNKWNMVLRQEPADAQTYTYKSFAIVGTLESVQEAMMALYSIHPTDTFPPEGYVDVLNCTEIAGWAWDPKAPDQPLTVEFYRVKADGSETLMGETKADRFREDLVPVLNDNGEHGYWIDPLPLLD